MADVYLPLSAFLDGEVKLPYYGIALAGLLAVRVEVELGELGAVEAVVGGGQEARGDQGGAALERLGREAS